jgi:hypothetical protein
MPAPQLHKSRAGDHQVSDNQNSPHPNDTPQTPPQQGIRRLLTLLLEIGLLAVLAFVVFSNWTAIKGYFRPDDKTKRERPVAVEPSGDKAAELDAFEKLNSFKTGKDPKSPRKYLVISERVEFDKPEKRVTSINYQGNQIDEEVLKLTARLYRIGTINADNSNIADDDLRYFSGLTALTSLVLTNTGITDAGMSHIRSLPNLEALHLSRTKVSDAGLDDIAHITTLKILNLSGTKVTDEGMKKLLSLTNLAWLLLNDTSLTDAGLDQLAAMKHLHRLTIIKTKVTAAGIDRLKKAIPLLAVDQ